MPMVSLAKLAEFFPGVLELPGRVADRTLVGYRRDTEQYLSWCDWEKDRALDPPTFRAWLQHQVEAGLSANTINRRRAAIQTLVRVSAACELFDERIAYRFRLVPPVSVTSLRGRLKEPPEYSPEQVRALFHAADATTLIGLRDRAMLATFASTGCRLSEVLSLQHEDIVRSGGAWIVLVLGKRQAKKRPAPLSHEAYDWIRRWLRARTAHGIDVPWLFTGVTPHNRPLPTPLTCCAAWVRVKRHAKQIGLPHLTTHHLRHFVGTQVAERHGLRAAQKTLGHKRLETTLIYVRDKLEPGLTEGLY